MTCRGPQIEEDRPIPCVITSQDTSSLVATLVLPFADWSCKEIVSVRADTDATTETVAKHRDRIALDFASTRC